ncbi:MAG: transposase [Solirubrobacterales bacterium]|jgi:transposase-like protein|nr:transposase [Solirubrobacterales bacterium]
MPPGNRHQPINAKSSTSDYSIHEFLADFPDDAACLEHLWRTRHAPDGEHAECPKCQQVTVFKRYATKQQRQSWTCTACGHRLHPTAGTIFHRSSTSLRLWFYAIHLITSTRCGISAKQLERELGVHYQTAWRMFNKIRNELMCDPEPAPMLKGEVEIDETAWGGKPRRKLPTRKEQAAFREAKPTILGMVERGGRVRLRVIASRRGEPLSREVRAHLDPAALMLTDDWVAYKPLRREFAHAVINHSAGEYVIGNVHTNTIEGFFGNLKTGMRGAYKKVSPKYLQSYLDEYAWRHNNRYHGQRSMFHALVREAARQ